MSGKKGHFRSELATVAHSTFSGRTRSFNSTYDTAISPIFKVVFCPREDFSNGIVDYREDKAFANEEILDYVWKGSESVPCAAVDSEGLNLFLTRNP